MPPSWTNNTDPNVDFDTKGRAYQVTLPFNAFWANLHRTRTSRSPTATTAGAPGSRATGAGRSSTRRIGRARASGSSRTSSGSPSTTFRAIGSRTTSMRPGRSITAARPRSGSRSRATAGRASRRRPRSPRPTRPDRSTSTSTRRWTRRATSTSRWRRTARPGTTTRRSTWPGRRTMGSPGPALCRSPAPRRCPDAVCRTRRSATASSSTSPPAPSTRATSTWSGRTGTEASSTSSSQSTNFGRDWSDAITVNDNVDAPGVPTDQFQPQVAAGPGGRWRSTSTIAAPPARTSPRSPRGRRGGELRIDVSLQAFEDDGGGAERVGGNVRVSEFSWDPEQPGQTIGGIDQMACAAQDPCTTRALSATTSASRSPRQTSTRLRCRPTIRLP